MPLLVMKFGGTSVADLDRIANAAKKVQKEVERGYDVIVIVSAMSGKTDTVSITTDTWSPADYGSGDRRTLGFSTSGLKALKLN